MKEERVPKLEVEGAGTSDVEEGKCLVLAIEEDAGVDIMHECGGYARCATCRVEFSEGEPEMMTQAELAMLVMRNLLGKARLSCQVLCDRDMKVRVADARKLYRGQRAWLETPERHHPHVLLGREAWHIPLK